MKLPPLTSVIEKGEDGWFVATCPELGIVSQGETTEHAEAMIKEAVELWLECAEKVRKAPNTKHQAPKKFQTRNSVW
ncbi:MAG TPA: type II toxin-antitoxin system HicB family antitoxin [Chthoniobacterales bacterium]